VPHREIGSSRCHPRVVETVRLGCGGTRITQKSRRPLAGNDNQCLHGVFHTFQAGTTSCVADRHHDQRDKSTPSQNAANSRCRFRWDLIAAELLSAHPYTQRRGIGGYQPERTRDAALVTAASLPDLCFRDASTKARRRCLRLKTTTVADITGANLASDARLHRGRRRLRPRWSRVAGVEAPASSESSISVITVCADGWASDRRRCVEVVGSHTGERIP